MAYDRVMCHCIAVCGEVERLKIRWTSGIVQQNRQFTMLRVKWQGARGGVETYENLKKFKFVSLENWTENFILHIPVAWLLFFIKLPVIRVWQLCQRSSDSMLFFLVTTLALFLKLSTRWSSTYPQLVHTYFHPYSLAYHEIIMRQFESALTTLKVCLAPVRQKLFKLA